MAINLVTNKWSKHIEFQYHMKWDNNNKGISNLTYIIIEQNIVDIMTKALKKVIHRYCTVMIIQDKKTTMTVAVTDDKWLRYQGVRESTI